MTLPEKLPVIFREKYGEVTAVFPTLHWSGPDDMTCYAHIGQHGACTLGWYHTARPARPEAYADLLAELRRIYENELGEGDTVFALQVRERISPAMHAARRASARP